MKTTSILSHSDADSVLTGYDSKRCGLTWPSIARARFYLFSKRKVWRVLGRRIFLRARCSAMTSTVLMERSLLSRIPTSMNDWCAIVLITYYHSNFSITFRLIEYHNLLAFIRLSLRSPRKLPHSRSTLVTYHTLVVVLAYQDKEAPSTLT